MITIKGSLKFITAQIPKYNALDIKSPTLTSGQWKVTLVMS